MQKERKELAEKQSKESSNTSDNSPSNSNSSSNVSIGDSSSSNTNGNDDDGRLNLEEFQGLLLGSMVCAWAECYRHTP